MSVVFEVPDLDEFAVLGRADQDMAFMAFERAERRLLAMRAAAVTEMERTQAFRLDGHRSVTNWVCGVANTSKTAAVRLVHTAAMFELLPALAAAVAAGEIGPEQIRLLVDIHDNPRARKHMGDGEALLVSSARSLVFHEFRTFCSQWVRAADPDGAHRDHELSRANRYVRTTPLGAGHRLEAEGDALTGETMTRILDAYTSVEYDIDIADRLARHGANAAKFPLARTHQQRRYDALHKIFLAAAHPSAAGAGGATGVTIDPLVVIHCTETELADAIREHFGARGSNPSQPGNGHDRPSTRLAMCQTAGGAPVDPHDLAVAAIAGKIRRIVIDSNGVAINLGRTHRLFTGAARDAILHTGDACIQPGCHLRHSQIQIDHLDPHTRGGPTDQDNGAPMCGPSNRAKHDGGFTVTHDTTGWHWHRPDGTEICPRPPP